MLALLLALAGPAMPFIERDACPGEYCQLGEWAALVKTPVYAKEGDERVASFFLAPSERFTALRGDTITHRPGEVALSRPYDGLKAGETMYLLSYVGEGSYSFYVHGKSSAPDSVSLLGLLDPKWPQNPPSAR